MIVKKSSRPVFTAVVSLFILFLAGNAQERSKEFTVDDIFSGSTFAMKGIRGFAWMAHGKAYSYLETDTAKKQTDIWKYEIASGKKLKLVDGNDLLVKKGDQPLSIQNYLWSPDESKILFTGTLTARSLKTGGNFFLYDPKTKEFRRLTDTEKEQVNVKFSPDEQRIGFVRENNLYVMNFEDGKETQLTFDGAQHVLNGHFDWVYEEEFGIIDGWQWSPDGKRIAFWQLDEHRVPDFPIMNFLPLHEEVTHMRYPKAGDPNSIVKIGVLNLDDKKTTWMNVGAPFDSTQDTYIPRIAWTPKGQLMIHELNRAQNKLDVFLADPSTGTSTRLFSETEKTWVDIKTDYVFLKRSDQFVWSSERDGFLHLYLYGLDGKLVRQLTQGEWDVERVAGVDEKSGIVYFTASVTSPLDRDLYCVKLDGSRFKRITKASGTHTVNLAPDFSCYIDVYSNVNAPPQTSVYKIDGSLVRITDDGTIAALKEYRISSPSFFTLKTSDSVSLNGWMIKPSNFDASKKYPVLMFVYGGPGSQTVRNSWGGQNFIWYQLLAQRGYMIVSVDNRGTGARGKVFKSVTYKHLGTWEAKDQIEAAKYLAALPYVDASRIGIWGWSYGGYMTLMALLEGGEVFKAGVSVAPVTSWKFYDSIYTERYMLTPKENPDGYEESAPITKAKNLQSKLLEVHGTADDNVHWQNTVTMVNELTKAGKQFETAFYPGGLHGIGGGKIRVQLFTRITNFILENL